MADGENDSRERILDQLQQFALAQIACGRREVSAIVSRRQFDYVPGAEERQKAKSLPWRKCWPLQGGTLIVYTDEPPLSELV